MKIKRTFVTALFCFGLICVIVAGVVSGRARFQTAPNLQTDLIKFCNLINNPRQYDGKTIRLEAVLVENHNTRVDGGDPILYDPACRKKDFTVVVEWPMASYENYKEAPAYKALEKTREKPDKRGNTRARVILVGEFNSSGERKYGHLDWADSQFVVHDIEAAIPVAFKVAWPK